MITEVMFLHLGNNKTVRTKDIVAIFDADTATVSELTKKYLSAADKRHLVETAVEEIPKSFVLYREKDGYKICFSQLAPSVLIGRMQAGYTV